MNELFNENNSESETELKINPNYAHSYDSWRQKEEFNKLKTKYGDHLENLNDSGEDSSSSEDEDEEGAELTEKFEKDFYKTLACLKNKDPRIYDEKVTFFDDASEPKTKSETKRKAKDKPMYLRDYERKVMIERDGKFSDSEGEEDYGQTEDYPFRAPTYVEEQDALKEGFKKILDSDDDDTGLLLKAKEKTKEDQQKEDEAYKEWLKGQATEIDGDEQKELKPLRDFWTDPKLDPKEKFLRDYILNKKFLDKESDNVEPEYDLVAHDSDENLDEDERNIETQENFEHKYNFRFEEPDHEFIKRYPRTMENSLRRKDTRRADKRATLKQRKEEEALKKREELKQLKAMKRKEIEEKLEKLKEITGNDDVNLNEIDLDGDFDPAEHDRRMQQMFNDDFYAGPEGDQKPEFPDIDEELDVETTWDKYDPTQEAILPENADFDGPHCDDPDFNMDADYDPSKSLQEEMIECSKTKRKRKRSKLAVAVAKTKPKFEPGTNPSYQAYLDQYYALDYEDMIGDLPCRFKYRNVVPNDYGLTVEEIIMADDKELNKWCSLKKALQHRPEHLELNDVRSYQQKAQNSALKKKIFRSIYGTNEGTESQAQNPGPSNQQPQEPAKKKRKRNKKKSTAATSGSIDETNLPAGVAEPVASVIDTTEESKSITKKPPTQKRRNTESSSSETLNSAQVVTNDKNIADSECSAEKTKKSKKQKTNKTKPASGSDDTASKASPKDTSDVGESNVSKESVSKNKSKRVKKSNVAGEPSAVAESSPVKKSGPMRKPGVVTKSKTKGMNKKQRGKGPKAAQSVGEKSKAKNKMRHNKVQKKKDLVTDLSAERLKAYGINPKKFRNKLKYGGDK